MADMTLNRSADRANLAEADELQVYARAAAIFDSTLDEVAAVLHAITAGGLFDAMPAAECDQEHHNAGTCLLSRLNQTVKKAQREIESLPGTDLFIYLDCRAAELRRADG